MEKSKTWCNKIQTQLTSKWCLWSVFWLNIYWTFYYNSFCEAQKKKSINVLLPNTRKIEKEFGTTLGFLYKNFKRFHKLSITCTVFFVWITTFLFSSLASEVYSSVILLDLFDFYREVRDLGFFWLRFMKFQFFSELNTHRPQQNVPLG